MHQRNLLVVSDVVSPEYSYGGPVVAIDFFIYLLSNEKWKVHVLSTKYKSSEQKLCRFKSFENIKIDRFIAYGKIRFSLRLLIALFRNFPRNCVVFINFTYSYLTILSFILAVFFRNNIVWMPHGALLAFHRSPKYRGLLKYCFNLTLRLLVSCCRTESVRVLCTSEAESLSVKKLCNSLSTHVLPIGLLNEGLFVECLAKFKPPAQLSFKNGLKLIFVGRLDPIKNIEYILHEMIRCEVLNVSLDIYGEGDISYVQSLSSLIGSLGLDTRVRLKGFLHDSEKMKVMSNYHFLVLPSHTENFGMVVVEALCAGLPVIASDRTPWAILNDFFAGYHLAMREGVLVELFSTISETSYFLMRTNASELYSNSFSVDKISSQVVEVFRFE